MKKYLAYTRVSTVKQSERGVSLEEQRAAIEHYARRHGLEIVDWYEETVTAAKSGRVVFSKLTKKLNKGEADGLIIHKVDRGARNLKDWSTLADLMDAGVDVRISSESYDLSSRGGRLSADIQAVIAADYIRNLREEINKGMRGRLKQGFCPWMAPLGYLDNGGGKPKTIDPVRGRLVKLVFELYSKGNYSLYSLANEMRQRGLRKKNGGDLNFKAIGNILNNPFYYGVIHVKKTGENYAGNHEPLVSKALYDRVQDLLSGRRRRGAVDHKYPYSRTFRCRGCEYSLIGEKQKKYVYYRCHTVTCDNKCVNQTIIDAAVSAKLNSIYCSPLMFEALDVALGQFEEKRDVVKTASEKALQDQLSRLEYQETRLLDYYIDEKIDDETYRRKQVGLKSEIANISVQLRENSADAGQIHDRIAEHLELVKSFINKRKTGPEGLMAKFVKNATSNPTVWRKNVDLPIHFTWKLFDAERAFLFGGPGVEEPRTNWSTDDLKFWANDTAEKLFRHFSDPQI